MDRVFKVHFSPFVGGHQFVKENLNLARQRSTFNYPFPKKSFLGRRALEAHTFHLLHEPELGRHVIFVIGGPEVHTVACILPVPGHSCHTPESTYVSNKLRGKTQRDQFSAILPRWIVSPKWLRIRPPDHQFFHHHYKLVLVFTYCWTSGTPYWDLYLLCQRVKIFCQHRRCR